MAEVTSEFSQKSSGVSDNNGQTTTEVWREFVDSTTLHGIRYVFMKRHILIRLLWMIVLLTSGGYYIFTVYRAFTKYYNRPVNTVLSRKHLKEMDFPAVTICPLNLFAKSKILMTDDNPLFASSGLNMSSCAVTSEVRGIWPCGWSLLCCCSPADLENVTSDLQYCTSQYKQVLLEAMQQYSNRMDVEGFFRYYSQDMSALMGPMCTFGWKEVECSLKDFAPLVTPWGMCYTFNSGTDSKVKTVDIAGVSSGLSLILDVQTPEYTQGKYSEGFKVLIHGQGEFIDEWEGINVGPGQHVVIALSQKQYQNLEKPYDTNCTKKTLKTFSTYTTEGCLHECVADNMINSCGCRPAGYRLTPGTPVCVSTEEGNCAKLIAATLDEEYCDCQVPCSQTKYHTEVSYSRFPDTGTADEFVKSGYYADVQYQRDNLVLLQVGFKSLSYEMQEQQPAYDSTSLFGEIGGNMGLFLGCSLLTICEFFDFLVSFVEARNRHVTHPAS